MESKIIFPQEEVNYSENPPFFSSVLLRPLHIYHLFLLSRFGGGMRTNEGWSKGGGGGGKLPCRSGGGGWQKRKGSSGCVRYEGSISRESGKKGADREGGRSLSLSERRQAAEGTFFCCELLPWLGEKEREGGGGGRRDALLASRHIPFPSTQQLPFLSPIVAVPALFFSLPLDGEGEGERGISDGGGGRCRRCTARPGRKKGEEGLA